MPVAVASAQHCPMSEGNADAAKPNKLYLYFPTRRDRNFPEFGVLNRTHPVKSFDVRKLGSNYPRNSTTAELRDAIFNVVVETFCEFNVQVIQTTTSPSPTDFPRTEIVAIGADSAFADWGRSDSADIGDKNPLNYARVWAGRYQHSDALDASRGTVERWARSIGGTCAHEAGHGYGLDHPDGLVLATGEDPLGHHLMADGNDYTWEERAGRRHFSNREYSLLASNVGLALQTMWNWDLVNPNRESAVKVRMDFLSKQSSGLILNWSYSGSESPWVNPRVIGSSGTATFHGDIYERYQLEWAVGQNWENGPSGQVPGGVGFHVGATFTSVNSLGPDPIIITGATLVDANGQDLALHPRLLGFDAGIIDLLNGSLSIRFFNTQPQPLSLSDLVVYQLPRVLSLDQMVQGGGMRDPHGIAFRPWPDGTQHINGTESIAANNGEYKVAVANMKDKRHIYEESRARSSGGDSTREPDVAKFTPGINADLFPATTVYITGTVVDPEARYWDQGKKKYVTGPLESRFYYQIAGRHPDLNGNGTDDYVEIATGKVKATKVLGVPDDVKISK